MCFSPLLKLNEPAPRFHLLDQNGLTVSLDNASGPNRTVLLFFASHFLPKDRQMLGAFAEAYLELQRHGLEVLAISGLNWETLYHLAQELELPYRVLFDPCCRVSFKYKTMMIPKFVTGRSVYWINSQGIVESANPPCLPEQILTKITNN